MIRSLRLAAVVAALSQAGCTLENAEVAPAHFSAQVFVCDVQPVLARECAFPACHGNTSRRLRVLAPGRMRLAEDYAAARSHMTLEDIEAGIQPPLTPNEVRFNFDQAVAVSSDPTERQMLTRPLSRAAGGTTHASAIGGDVFDSPDAAGYRAIERWLDGEDTCTGAPQ